MTPKGLTLLHTSDWHLGRSLHGRARYDEFQSFLRWLVDTIEQRSVDVLLVAGDVFDTSAPSNQAQTLYYRFLSRVARSNCRHVVVIAGNHDSPTFLNAPRHLLSALNVHVVGQASDEPADEVLVLRDEHGAPELIVGAVPYLRDRDVRTAQAGESPQDKERKLVAGIRGHYQLIATHAAQWQTRLQQEVSIRVPVVGMGHLFAAGGQTVEGDGVRELYVGSLARVAADVFGGSFDYLALGHLHVPQIVGGNEHIRYSGSPIAMGFGEASQQKSVCLVHLLATLPDSASTTSSSIQSLGSPPDLPTDLFSEMPAQLPSDASSEFSATALSIEMVPVPVFQPLRRLRGDFTSLTAELKTLAQADRSAWLEVVYDGQELVPELRNSLEKIVAGTKLQLLRIKLERPGSDHRGVVADEKTLDELTPAEVFERCLSAHQVPDHQRAELQLSYREALASLHDDDARAAG